MSLLSSLFKTSKTPSYGGIQPYGALMDAQGGREYYNTILNRSQGGSKGYGEDYVSNANPQISESHNNYTGYQLPELKSELSATGRRAGSSGFQQIARSMSDQSDKENSIKARLAQNQSEAIYNDTNNGINDLGAFNTGDFNARATLADYQQRQYAQETNNIQHDQGVNDAKGQRVAQSAIAIGGMPFTGGASAAGLATAFGGTPAAQPSAFDNYLKSITARTPAATSTSKLAGNWGSAGGVK